MKHRISYIVSTLLVGGVLVAAPAVALAETSTSTTTSTSGSTSASDTSTTTPTTNNTTDVETKDKNLSDRLAAFETKFQVKLTLAEANSLKLHCVAAQGAVGQLNARFGVNVKIRSKAYAAIQARLTKLIADLKAKNISTTTLEQEQTALNTKIATFNTDLTAYQQSLADLKAEDCKTDPTGFQAALTAARSAHDTLVSDATAISTYVTGTIKPTLQTLLQTLQTTKTNTSGSSN